MKHRELLIIVLLASLFAVSCGASDGPHVGLSTIEVRDSLGKSVRVPENVTRAVSLAPNITEMVFAIGAGDRLVGVTTYCNYPVGATAKEKVGDTQTPNIEKIIALKPQVVLISTASQLEAFNTTLAEQGIAVYVLDAKSLDGVLENLRQLGQLFGKREAAENLVVSLSGRATAIRQRSGHGRHEPLRVFLQISNEPLFTIGKDSFLTELLEHAGGMSVTKDVPSGYPKLSKETAAALDPDVIFLSDSEDNREPNGVFKNSKAVRTGRVYRINADIISRPGPRLVDALEEIASKLREKDQQQPTANAQK